MAKHLNWTAKASYILRRRAYFLRNFVLRLVWSSFFAWRGALLSVGLQTTLTSVKSPGMGRLVFLDIIIWPRLHVNIKVDLSYTQRFNRLTNNQANHCHGIPPFQNYDSRKICTTRRNRWCGWKYARRYKRIRQGISTQTDIVIVRLVSEVM